MSIFKKIFLPAITLLAVAVTIEKVGGFVILASVGKKPGKLI